MAKADEWIIRKRSLKQPAGFRHAEKVNFWHKNKKHTIINLIITIIILAGISVGLYFLIVKLKEGFGCGCSTLSEETDKMNIISQN